MTSQQVTMTKAPAPLQSSLTLGALPSAVPCARLHTRHVLWEWGLAHLADTVELIVSELVTNSIKATRALPGPIAPPIRLRLSSDHTAVVVEVWDGNIEPPGGFTVAADVLAAGRMDGPWVDQGVATVNAGALGLDTVGAAGQLLGAEALADLSLGPVGAGIAVGTGVYLAGAYAYQHWAPFRHVVQDIGHGAVDVTRDVGHGAVDVTRDVGHGLADAAHTVASWF